MLVFCYHDEQESVIGENIVVFDHFDDLWDILFEFEIQL